MPDIFLCNTKELNDDIIQCIHQIARLAKENHVVLEYNIEGLRDHVRGRIWPNGTTTGYPRKEFWEIIATYNIPVILGSDVHDPNGLNDEVTKQAYLNCKELNLNLIDYIDLV